MKLSRAEIQTRRLASVGHKKSFNGWKLIWVNAEGNTVSAAISERAARALQDMGFPLQG